MTSEGAVLTEIGPNIDVISDRRSVFGEEMVVTDNSFIGTVDADEGGRGIEEDHSRNGTNEQYEDHGIRQDQELSLSNLPVEGVARRTDGSSDDGILAEVEPSTTRVTTSEIITWVDDAASNNCLKCGVRFNLLNRKHHCRRCGHIFCGNCCHQFIRFLNGMLIINKEGNKVVSNDERNMEFRTCSDCYQEIHMIWDALRDAHSMRSHHTPAPTASRDCSVTPASDDKSICDGKLLVYVQQGNELKDEECIICFEGFEDGQKLVRLECLCVYHYHCMQDWIDKCGGVVECPVHRQSM